MFKRTLTVDSILANLNNCINSLSEVHNDNLLLAAEQREEATTHNILANFHEEESARAARVSAKLTKLLS